MQSGLVKKLETLKHSGKLERPLPQCKDHVFDSDAYCHGDVFVQHETITGYHPTSTCRMGGADDTNAVVDPALRVRG